MLSLWYCCWSRVHCPIGNKPNSDTSLVREKKGFIAWHQVKRWEKISQIYFPRGSGLGIFKNKGSGCHRACRWSGICWLGVRKKEVSSLLSTHRNPVSLCDICSRWHTHEEGADLGVCHLRVPFIHSWSLVCNYKNSSGFSSISAGLIGVLSASAEQDLKSVSLTRVSLGYSSQAFVYLMCWFQYCDL